MTREKKEQLIRHLKYNLKIGADYLITDDDAVEIIKALEQETCEDCISRQAVLAIAGDSCLDLDSYEDTREFCDEIKALSPVTPQHTDAEIQKMQELEQAEIQKAYELGKEDKIKVLDKIRAEIVDTLYVDSLIFGELIDFKNGKISADDVIEEFNQVTRTEVLKIIDKYKAESENKG